MPGLSLMERFSTISAAARVEAVLDAGSFEPLPEARTTVITGRGRVDGRAVWIAATDPTRARGALGVAEAAALCTWFQTAGRDPQPLLLLLDSAGAKVDEGLAALGAFRRLFRDALLARLAGVPMLAVLGRSCFGGSSMLACVCHTRLYSTETLLAVSGPGVIEALSGRAELDASDPQQVRTLMGAEARSRLGPDELSIEDHGDAFQAAVSAWIHQPALLTPGADTAQRHERLRQRLQSVGPDPSLVSYGPSQSDTELLIPSSYQRLSRGPLLVGFPPPGSAKPAFLGALGGSAIGAQTCWELADELQCVHQSNPASPIVLLLDASGHAATRRDEALMLSAYLAHLSIVTAELVVLGHRIVLWIPGAAAGAVYVAFAAPVQNVSALPSARIRILPEAAVRQIVGASAEEAADPDTLMQAGVIDALLDRRLEPCAAAPAAVQR